MPTEVAVMLCPYEDSTPTIRRAKAQVITRAYREQKRRNKDLDGLFGVSA